MRDAIGDMLIAILRGVQPAEAAPVAEALLAHGFTRIEVPLHSPQALMSLSRIVETFGADGPSTKDVAFGAGTVLSAHDVARAAGVGARFIVSPNYDAEVIAATKAAGLTSIPGVVTPSECFAALAAGADALKLFPATQVGARGLRALREVLPKPTRIIPVGGVDESQFAEWKAAGACGFGVGGALYRPGMTTAEVSRRALLIVARYRVVMA